MTASPRPLAHSVEGHAREVEYYSHLESLSPEELLERMPLDEAELIDQGARDDQDILLLPLSDKALSCRFNQVLYDEIIEEFIDQSPEIQKLRAEMKKSGSHEAGERSRLLHSALAAIYFHLSEE